MLDPEHIHAASALLITCWEEGRLLEALPQDLRPATRTEGYAIQARLMERTSLPLFGWKIAATSEAGQKHIGVDGPMAGRILAERVGEVGAEISLANNHMGVAEVEFAFRMAQDLPPRAAHYEVDEVLAAVGSLHPAIEIPDSRYQDFAKVGAPQLIADDACAHLFVLGPAVSVPWRDIDLVEYGVTARITGKSEFQGKGANVLGDPRKALTWIVNELSALGIPLRAGEVVTTGTCVTPIKVMPGDEVVGDFGALGSVSVRFA